MLRKLGKRITNNFGLKILAAMFAVVLWIVVMNIDDPIKDKQFTVGVTPTNQEFIAQQGKYYEWLDGANTVTFRVSAKRGVMTGLSSSDFSAIANMERIVRDEDTGNYRVPVSVTATKYSDAVTISSKRLYLDVVLEDLGRTQKAIGASTRGNVADGCAIGDLKIVGSNVLKISGPLSIVSQIETAVATINVDGMSSDVTDNVVPMLYDAEGNVIDATKLKLSLSTVSVSAQILNTKDVALEFSSTGRPAEGYMVTGIEQELATVRIKGEAGKLNPVNKIVIPQEVLDVTGVTEDLATTVDISSYLPQGISLVLSSDAKVDVVVKVEPLVTQTFEVPVANLSFENLRDGYTAECTVDRFMVEVAGPKSAMDNVKAADIRGVVDVGGLGRGDHHLAVDFSALEAGYWASTTVRVPVTISSNPQGANGNAGAEAGAQMHAGDSGNTAPLGGDNAASEGADSMAPSGAGGSTSGGAGNSPPSGTGSTSSGGAGNTTETSGAAGIPTD